MRGRPLPPDSEDYESLGHTFLHGKGDRTLIAKPEPPEPEPPGIDWTRLIFWATGLAVIALAVLVGRLVVWIIHHSHHATHAAGPSSAHNSGGVFALLVVGAAIIIAVRAIGRFFRGE